MHAAVGADGAQREAQPVYRLWPQSRGWTVATGALFVPIRTHMGSQGRDVGAPAAAEVADPVGGVRRRVLALLDTRRDSPF